MPGGMRGLLPIEKESHGWSKHSSLASEITVDHDRPTKCVADDFINDDDEEDEMDDDDLADEQPIAYRAAPQDTAAALNAAAMVRRIREQQRQQAALGVESPSKRLDALAGGSS